MTDDRNDRIAELLRGRPSDERDYDEPLRVRLDSKFAEPVASPLPGAGVRVVGAPRVGGVVTGVRRPIARSRPPLGLVAVLVVLFAVVTVALAGGFWNRVTNELVGPAGTQADSIPTYQLTGRVGCFGQGPGWTPSPAGPLNDCPNMAVPPEGYAAATWTLDPAYPYSPDSTELHVLAMEQECASGQSATGRVVKNVAYESDRVVVTLVVIQREGAQTCQGNPPTPVVLTLDQPIGSRTLYDGGSYPAVAVAAGGMAIVTPSPTPYPSNWHEPMDCSSDVDVASFFKMASMNTSFDVYCPVLPAGWSVKRTDSGALGTATADQVRIDYVGPNGQTFGLMEGAYCQAATPFVVCDRIGPEVGTASFGDRPGTLGGNGSVWWVATGPSDGAMWEAWGTDMTRDEFEALLATLIIVGK